MSFLTCMPDLSGYDGEYKVTASVNADGSEAEDYDEESINSYKYMKIEPQHVHDYGIEWKTDTDHHWNECSCGDVANKAAHADGNADGKCDVCAYAMSADPLETTGAAGSDPVESDPENEPSVDDPDKKDGLGAGAIAGIAVGSVAVALLGGFSLLWFGIKKKSFADLVAVFKK